MTAQTTRLEKLRPGHYVHAVRAGELIFCAGMPGNAEGGLLVRSPDALPPEGRQVVDDVVSTVRDERIAAQAWRALENLRTLLEDQGTDLSRLVLLRVYTPVPDRLGVVERVLQRVLGGGHPPLSCVAVEEVARNREVEIAFYPVVATARAAGFTRLPAQPGPDSQVDVAARGAAASLAEGLVWVPLLTPRPLHEPALGDSLQPSSPARPEPDGPASAHDVRVAGQSSQLLAGLAEILHRAGSGLSGLVHLRVYFRDLRDWPVFLRVANRLLAEAPPTYTFLQLPPGGASRPGTLVELEAVAAQSDTAVRRWPDVDGLVGGSVACQAGRLLFCGGLASLPSGSRQPVGGYGDAPEAYKRFASGVDHDDEREGPVVAQAWAIFARLQALLAERGLEMGNLVNLSYALTNMRDFPSFNRVVRDVIPRPRHTSIVAQFPAVGLGDGERACIEAVARLP